jgi:hypothetical protein
VNIWNKTRIGVARDRQTYRQTDRQTACLLITKEFKKFKDLFAAKCGIYRTLQA